MNFYPNHCRICGIRENLTRCNKCNLVSYCGSSHQQQDLQEHKDICCIIWKMMEEKKVSHIFENLRNVNLIKWKQERENTLREVQLRLGRYLKFDEKQIFLFPRVCNVCHEARQEFLKNCPRCPSVSFCKLHPGNFLHDIVCPIIKASHTREVEIKKMGLEIEEKVFLELLRKTRSHKSQMELMSMTDCLNNHFEPPLDLSENLKIYTSELLTLPMTLFNALGKINNPPSSQLVVHLFCTWTPLCHPKLWEILFHFLPQLTALKIVLIKHEIFLNEREVEKLKVQLCEKCKFEKKNLTIYTVSSSYTDYLNDSNFKIPNLVAVYDYEPMFTENIDDTKKQIANWVKLKCPIFVTTRIKNNAQLLTETLLSASDRFLIFYTGHNYFRPLSNMRNWEDDGICHQSQFIVVFQRRENFVNENFSTAANPPPNFFYPSLCQVCHCAKPSKMCNKCKMIFYCGNQHLEEDRPKHKDVCKVILWINSKNGTTNLFANSDKNNAESWLKARIDFLKEARFKLGRELRDFEEQMFLFPKTCFVCHESDLSILRDCECGVSLCKIHKKDPIHNLRCKDLSIAFKLKMIDEPLFPKVSLKFLEDKKNDKLPSSMQNFLEVYLKPMKCISDYLKKLEITNIQKIIISDFFTKPLTFMYALQKLNFSVKKSIIVHVIGATNNEISELDYWKFPLYWLQKLKNLKISFVGPEIRNSTLESKCENQKRLKFPTKNFPIGKNVDLNKIRARYEEYCESSSFEKPHIVLGFNLHIDESESRFSSCTWKETILALSELKVPFVMTSGTMERAEKDHKRLCLLLNQTINFTFSEQNPFASLIPERDFETENLKYSNNYVTIYTKWRGRPKLVTSSLPLVQWDPRFASFQLCKYNLEPEEFKKAKSVVKIQNKTELSNSEKLRMEMKSSDDADINSHLKLTEDEKIREEMNFSVAGNSEHETKLDGSENSRIESGIEDMDSTRSSSGSWRKEITELEMMRDEKDLKSESKLGSKKIKPQIKDVETSNKDFTLVKEVLEKTRKLLNEFQGTEHVEWLEEILLIVEQNCELRNDVNKLERKQKHLEQKRTKMVEENRRIKNIKNQVKRKIHASTKQKK